MAGPAPDLKGVAAIAFTSANGVEAFAARCADRRPPVFAVGAATAAAARAAGFSDVVSADGGVNELVGLIAKARAGLPGEILHAGPAEPAGDLGGALRRRGLSARGIAVYETVGVPPEPGREDLARSADAVLLHSPKAAVVLATWLAERRMAHPTAFCLSAAVAEPLARTALSGLVVADTPTEVALLEKLVAAARADVV